MTPVMLYLHFALYGFLCFGGGYMLIPFITADLVNGGYLSQGEFANLSSIAQITPGPIGLNTATYVGYLQSGVPGSLLASLGLVTPAFLMVIMALKLLKRYENTVFIKGVKVNFRCLLSLNNSRADFLAEHSHLHTLNDINKTCSA